MGTQAGNITFYDLDTGKANQNIAFESEIISDICGLGDCPFILVGNVVGEMMIIALPPMPYKYTRVFRFFNEDSECIHSFVYCPKKKWLFLLEESTKRLKVFDFTDLVEQLPQMSMISRKTREEK